MAAPEPQKHEERGVSHQGSLGKVAGFGALLTLVASAVAWAIWGAPGLAGCALFGGIGVGVHLWAAAVLRRRWGDSFKRLTAGYAAGLALRLTGAVGAFVAVTVAPNLFAPIPTLFGYLVVVVPLLFTEIRFLR